MRSVPVVSRIVPLLRIALSVCFMVCFSFFLFLSFFFFLFFFFFFLFDFSSVVYKSNADTDTRTCEPDWPSGN